MVMCALFMMTSRQPHIKQLVHARILRHTQLNMAHTEKKTFHHINETKRKVEEKKSSKWSSRLFENRLASENYLARTHLFASLAWGSS